MQRTTHKLGEQWGYKHHPAKDRIELQEIECDSQGCGGRKRNKGKSQWGIPRGGGKTEASRLIEKNTEPPRKLALTRNGKNRFGNARIPDADQQDDCENQASQQDKDMGDRGRMYTFLYCGGAFKKPTENTYKKQKNLQYNQTRSTTINQQSQR